MVAKPNISRRCCTMCWVSLVLTWVRTADLDGGACANEGQLLTRSTQPTQPRLCYSEAHLLRADEVHVFPMEESLSLSTDEIPPLRRHGLRQPENYIGLSPYRASRAGNDI